MLGMSVALRADKLHVPHCGWLLYPQNDVVARGLRQGDYESAEQAFFHLFLREGDRVLDVGAHVGLFSAIAARRVGASGRVYALEPNPRNLELLQLNFRAHGLHSADALGKGLYGKAGAVAFQDFGEGETAYSRLDPNGLEGSPGSRQVEVCTLDGLAASLGESRFDLVKLDVEGFELEIVRSLDPVWAAGLAPLWMVEFGEENLRRRGGSSTQLWAALREKGYEVCAFDAVARRLVPADVTGPVPYDNLFAAADVAAVNGRLQGAPVEAREVADDLLARGGTWRHFSEERLGVIQEQQRYIEELETLNAGGRRLGAISAEQRAYIDSLLNENGRLQTLAAAREGELVDARRIVAEQRAYVEALRVETAQAADRTANLEERLARAEEALTAGVSRLEASEAERVTLVTKEREVCEEAARCRAQASALQGRVGELERMVVGLGYERGRYFDRASEQERYLFDLLEQLNRARSRRAGV